MVCFLVSDFKSPAFERHLKMIAKKHDLICIEVKDRRETTLPEVGLIELQDAENGETYLLDTHSPGVRSAFHDITNRDDQALRSLLRRLHVDHVEVFTHANLLEPILKLFRLRSKRR